MERDSLFLEFLVSRGSKARLFPYVSHAVRRGTVFLFCYGHCATGQGSLDWFEVDLMCCCSVLQCVAVWFEVDLMCCCSVLQCVAVCCSVV